MYGQLYSVRVNVRFVLWRNARLGCWGIEYVGGSLLLLLPNGFPWHVRGRETRHIARFSLYLQGAPRHSVNVDIVVATKQIDVVTLVQSQMCFDIGS